MGTYYLFSSVWQQQRGYAKEYLHFGEMNAEVFKSEVMVFVTFLQMAQELYVWKCFTIK